MLLGIALAIFAGTLWLYWPSVHGTFLAGDDIQTYLLPAERLNGLTWNAVKWAFTTTSSYYQPLVRLSHVLDYQLWGKNAVGHHVDSILVHALNAALVFGFAWTLFGAASLTAGERLTVALWVAVVFAIHPLQVESAAWISGRTQVLCTTFAIASLWAYARGARRWLVWVFYVAALMCKPMAVSLPFAMLAIDCFPLRRYERLGWGRLLWEKAAMLALAAAVALATVVAKSHIDQVFSLAVIPFSERVYLAFESLTFYPLKLIWPAHLSPYYPLDLKLAPEQWPVLVSVLAVIILTVVAISERWRVPMLGAAWGAYVALILPVSGLMPTATQVIADRYAYLAMLPLLLLAGGTGAWLWRHSMTAVRLALIGLAVAQLCVFEARTRNLIPEWHDDETELRAGLAEFPDSEELNRTLAMILLDQGRAAEALPYAQRDVEIAPDLFVSHTTLGRALRNLGRSEEATAQDRQALQMDPDSAGGHFNFGLAMIASGKPLEAMENFRQALQIKPDFIKAHYHLGVVLYQARQVEDAIKEFEAELRINPEDNEAHVGLGDALLSTGDVQNAIAQFDEALKIRPDYAEAHANLGLILLKTGRIPEAIGHYEQALRILPDDAKMHDKFGQALWQANRPQEAIDHFKRALQIKPDYVEAHFDLGLALEKTGRTPEAIEQYEQVLKIRPDFVPATQVPRATASRSVSPAGPRHKACLLVLRISLT